MKFKGWQEEIKGSPDYEEWVCVYKFSECAGKEMKQKFEECM